MKNYRAEKCNFEQLEKRVPEESHRCVESLGSFVKLVDGSDMQQQIEQQQDSRDPLNHPRQGSSVLPAIFVQQVAEPYSHTDFVNFAGRSMALLRRPIESVRFIPLGQTATQ